MAEDDEKEPGIYRVDTVPPPAGENDAYNAPTKVGPMPAATIAEMMRAAERKVAEVNERAAEKAEQQAAAVTSSKRPAAVEETAAEAAARAESDSNPTKPPPPPGDDVPRVYDEESDDAAATLLSPRARPPATPLAVSAVVDDVTAHPAHDAAPLAPPSMSQLAPPRRRTFDVVLVIAIAVAAALITWWLRR